jgi:hypothetical protein
MVLSLKIHASEAAQGNVVQFDVHGCHVGARAGRAAPYFVNGQKANNGGQVFLLSHGYFQRMSK